jgi:dinuclear metal center YbgI/SA1388 family protein
VRVGELLAVLDRLAPMRLCEEWDNVGLMVGRRDRPVTRVLVALDLRAHVLDEARGAGADLVLVHHPPIFPALSAVSDQRTAGALVLRAAEERIAVVAAHTNLDSVAGGLNDLMADALGMRDRVPLVPDVDDPAMGLGRAGMIDPAPLDELASRCVEVFCTRRANLGVAGDPGRLVSRLAVCTGSGGSLIAAARQWGADAYVTGDLKYHDADAAEGMGLMNIAHGAVEQHAMRMWTPVLAAALAPHGVEVAFARGDTDPWRDAC